ncbi:nodulin MtN21 /EamA-like transporter family protein [Striga asiatica]|uniref:WAT1-related protein n=1 Tax=Striga asiatica TaxID=4170 RepID=A0A5A7P663_STRAF|nr:nodulin MtN21 /EamA-like transporter family protein [Striga asiatica]
MYQESLLYKAPKIMIRIWLSENRVALEDAFVFIGLLAVQFLYAGNSILLSYILKFRSLFMKGTSLTSPAMATAMPNLAPGLIFIIAWASRLEKIELGCIYSQAKIIGTLLCVFGAVTMSLMQSIVQRNTANDSPPAAGEKSVALDNQTIIGCIYLIAAVLVLSSQVVLQAITLHDFPAPISLCALTSLIGGLTTAIFEIFEDHKTEHAGWPLLTVQEMVLYAIFAGSVSGMCVSMNAWAMKKRGPVIVSIFNPLGTVISTIFSVITLKQSICVGSLGGMCLMFIGLYCVLWAKRKEGFSVAGESSLETDPDLEKLLLA